MHMPPGRPISQPPMSGPGSVPAQQMQQHSSRPSQPPAPPFRSRVRVRWAKLGRLVALSHLEAMHTLLRAIRRAGLPVAYSQGYHPKPRVSFGPALAVGIESRAEFIEHVRDAWPEYNRLYAHPFEWTWTNHKMRRWYADHTP